MNYNEIQTLLQFHVKKSCPRLLSATRLLAISWNAEKTTFVMILKARKQISAFQLSGLFTASALRKYFR